MYLVSMGQIFVYLQIVQTHRETGTHLRRTCCWLQSSEVSVGLFCLRFNVAAAAVVNFDNLASQSRSQSKFEFNGHRGCTCAWCLMPPLVGWKNLVWLREEFFHQTNCIFEFVLHTSPALFIQSVARFSRWGFGIFPWLAGRYCSCLLPKQTLATSSEQL